MELIAYMSCLLAAGCHRQSSIHCRLVASVALVCTVGPSHLPPVAQPRSSQLAASKLSHPDPGPLNGMLLESTNRTSSLLCRI